jgi:hypothetical protein
MTDSTRPEYSPEQVEAAKEYLDERQEMYQRQAVSQVLNGNTADAAKWEEEATAIRTILSALAKAEGDSKDAQRWRWWREHATTRIALPMVRRSFDGDIPIDDKMLQWSAEIPGELSTLFLSDPDRAIDAAMTKERE